MSAVLNAYQQPVGPDLPQWTARPRPARTTLDGSHCRIEPLDAARHGDDLYAAYVQAADARDWTYLTVGPFADPASFRTYLESAATSTDPLHFAIIDLKTDRAVGTYSLMRIDPPNGVIEVGNVNFSPLLKQTAISTEAQYLLMQYAFDELGYRRYEWKCDSLNAPSRKTAERLGFQFEGIFRQALVYKGRSRDTAWFSITDREWPAVGAAFERWLAPDNFDAQGRQLQSLTDIRNTLGTDGAGGRDAELGKDEGTHAGTGNGASRAGAAATTHATASTAVPPARQAPPTIRALTEADHAQWLPLWRGYQTFYNVTLGDAIDRLTWSRLHDAAEPMFVLGAFDAQDRLVGIVHAIYHRSTWTEGMYCYLQDLFTAPESRGSGVGRALIEAVSAHASEAGAGRLYWLTHESNHAGRALYDKVAQNAGFIQYRRQP